MLYINRILLKEKGHFRLKVGKELFIQLTRHPEVKVDFLKYQI